MDFCPQTLKSVCRITEREPFSSRHLEQNSSTQGKLDRTVFELKPYFLGQY